MRKSFLSGINVRRFSGTEKIHFAINLSIGILIALFFHFLEHTDWGEDTINKAFDFVIAREAGNAAGAVESLTSQRSTRATDRIVFVEIDDEAYRKWGKPLVTPRDRLAEIVESAYKGGAKVILLDILLEDRDCCHPDGDRKLRNVLQDMTNGKAASKVIFPVRIGRDGGVQKKSLFEDLLRGNPNFYTATAGISATATDRVVRYWIPFEAFKDGGDTTILWNMSFIAAMLAEGKESEIKECEKRIKTGTAHGTQRIELSNGKSIKVTSDREDIYSNRIRFLLVPKNALSDHAGGNLFDGLYKLDETMHATFKDKIVIIGNSSPDAGDMHPTPIGNLAGMFIIGNATNTIALGIQPSRSPAWLNLLIEAFVVIMAAFLFLHFHSFLAQLLGSSVLMVSLGIVSYYYFLYTGTFLNFIFAVAGMSFHRIATNIEEIALKKGARTNSH